MKRVNVRIVTVVIFYGALWGLMEASMGHILHFMPGAIAGSIMFPIAAFILVKAYKQLESKKALFFIGVVAASIKSIDLLLPQISVLKTINPMLSIILESLVVVSVITLYSNDKVKNNIVAALGSSFGWRVVFAMFMVAQYSLGMNGLALKYTTSSFLVEFILVSGLISGLFAFILVGLLRVPKFKLNYKLNVKPIHAGVLLAVASIVTYIL